MTSAWRHRQCVIKYHCIRHSHTYRRTDTQGWRQRKAQRDVMFILNTTRSVIASYLQSVVIRSCAGSVVFRRGQSARSCWVVVACKMKHSRNSSLPCAARYCNKFYRGVVCNHDLNSVLFWGFHTIFNSFFQYNSMVDEISFTLVCSL